jgi:hypothetical protein
MEVGMRLTRIFPAVLFAAAIAAPAAAQQAASKKFEWNPIKGIQDIDLSVDRIIVNQVDFDLGSTLKGTPIRKSSAQVRVRIDNNGEQDEQVGIAVVVFDAEGNVVGAGSQGTKWGYLNKGSRTYYTIDFPYLYRRLDQAASFLVTLETQTKSSGKKPTSSTKAVESEPLPTPVP